MQKLEFSRGNHDGPRRAVAIVGTTYDVDGEAMTFGVPFDTTILDTRDGCRMVVAVPESARDAACFNGADGIEVWRRFVHDPAYDVCDLATCTALRPWPDDRWGRGIPTTNFGGHHPGSAQHHAADVRRKLAAQKGA